MIKIKFNGNEKEIGSLVLPRIVIIIGKFYLEIGKIKKTFTKVDDLINTMKEESKK